MDATNIASLATLLGAVATVASVGTGYLLSKRKDRYSAQSAERQQLSADQKAFIETLKEENRVLRERLDKVEAEFGQLKEIALKDRLQVAELEKRLSERNDK